MEAIVWTVTVVLLIAGLVGAFLPGIPSAPLVLVAGALHKYFLPAYLSWWTLGAFASGVDGPINWGRLRLGNWRISSCWIAIPSTIRLRIFGQPRLS